ncbi:DUF397 domain-containing protein [Actinomadura sp. NPDC048955]|uniref:DUF397 domain-containing protein n=1 Tax=Actinomadura sp. NPDC048955 TaxID=3158228 RepID=UPI0033C2A69A
MDLTNLTWRKASRSGENGGNCVELAGLAWRKSSLSGENGGDCVELANLAWRKARQSLSNGGECVELAGAVGVVAVRDSKDPDGPVLLLTRAALRTAVQSVADMR